MSENNESGSGALSAESIDDIIASGDPDAIDKAMAEMSLAGNESGVVEQSTEVAPNLEPELVENVDTSDGDDTAQGDEQAAAAQEGADTTQTIDGVLTQDGKHVIPYAVLSGAREQLSEANKQVSATQAEMDELKNKLAEQQRLLDLNKAHFEKNNLDVPVLPENEQIDLDNLDDYGDIGKAVRVLAHQNQQMSKQLESRAGSAPAQDSPDAPADVMSALEANPVLKGLVNNPATHDQVVAIDNQLRQSHPHLSMAERFDLVVVKHNENVAKLISEKTPQQPAVPASMSDVSAETLQPQLSAVDQLVAATDSAQAAQLENMSEAQLESLFEQLG